MELMMNDISFQYQIYDKETALNALHQLIMLCKTLESGKFSNVKNKIITCEIDKTLELVPGFKFISIIQQLII